MKNRIYILLLCLFGASALMAQTDDEKPIRIKGSLNHKYRNVYLEREVINYLFVKERAQIPILDRYNAYYVDLDAESKAKMNRDYILLIFIDGTNHHPSSDRHIEIERDILPLHSSNPGTYYTAGIRSKSVEERRKDPYYRFWENPTANDTITNMILWASEIYTPLLIDALSVTKPVYQETITYQLTATDNIPQFGFAKIDIPQLARTGLKDVSEYGALNPPKLEASQLAWKNWFAALPGQMRLKKVTEEYPAWVTYPREWFWNNVFIQHGDTIFGYTSDSLFIFNTRTYEMERTVPGTFSWTKMGKKEYEEQKETPTYRRLVKILDHGDFRGQFRYLNSKNGDVIIAKHNRNKFQQFATLHRLRKSTSHIGQGLTIETSILVEEGSDYGLKIVGLFETKDSYIVITRKGIVRQWYRVSKSALK